MRGNNETMKTWPWNAIVAEAVGTFLFFFVGMGAAAAFFGGAGLLGVALAHGLALIVLVSALGAVSGGHFNPAVSFALWIAGRLEGRRAIAYVIAQLLGGVLAAVALAYVLGSTQSIASTTPALLQAGSDIPAIPSVDVVRGIVIEAILTAVLLAAVFGTVVDPRAPRLGGLAIGVAVAADILMGGALTGAAMNPARWFAPALVTGQFDNAVVWVIGPLLGAAAVAALWRILFLPEADAQTGADI
ncbi:MAG: aquaporin [Chloroflexota bacterium]|jgi:MIP family channel proteins|nr:aquaporin [Chloroflexota bacterium]